MIRILLLFAMFVSLTTTSFAQDFSVVRVKPVSIKHVKRFVVEVEYKLLVRNNGYETIDRLSGVAVPKKDRLKLTDVEFSVLDIAPHSRKWTDDGISVVINLRKTRRRTTARSFNFSFDDGSIEGIDSNSDGVRDDVAARIEVFFGEDALDVPQPMLYLQNQQFLIENQISDEDLILREQSVSQALFCWDVDYATKGRFLEIANALQFDTEERRLLGRQLDQRLDALGGAFELQTDYASLVGVGCEE